MFVSLQMANKSNNIDLVSLMVAHAKKELSTGTWRLLGWWKAASTTEAAVYNPRLHIVNLVKNQPVVWFVTPGAPLNIVAGPINNGVAPAADVVAGPGPIDQGVAPAAGRRHRTN